MRAHRASWEIENGAIPAGFFVLHRCDNAGCVNPEHLFLGTLAMNNKDRQRKGRTARGTTLPQSKLNDERVLDIRRRFLNGETVKSIAERHGVERATVRRIRDGRGWTHVTLDAG